MSDRADKRAEIWWEDVGQPYCQHSRVCRGDSLCETCPAKVDLMFAFKDGFAAHIEEETTRVKSS